MADAYAVAELNRQRRHRRAANGLLGYKIGFTNRSIWDALRRARADLGPGVGQHGSAARRHAGARSRCTGLVQPRLEPEVMFGFASSPRRGMDEAELVGCIEWVAHGFEIVHTHFADWRFAAADTVADFALHGRLFVGPRVPIERFADPRAELAALKVRLLCGDRAGRRRRGHASCSTVRSTALRIWVDAMAAQAHGWQVNAGDIVSTGTLDRCLAALAGPDAGGRNSATSGCRGCAWVSRPEARRGPVAWFRICGSATTTRRTDPSERWQSGRMYLTRNQACGIPYRGFESLPLRQLNAPMPALCGHCAF